MQMRRALFFGALICLPGQALADRVPVLPAGPVFDANGYPTCQNDYQKQTKRVDRSLTATQCIQALERYNTFVMPRYPAAVAAYSKQLNDMEAAFRKTKSPPADKLEFAKMVNDRLGDYKSKDRRGQFGQQYSNYYMRIQQYQDDERVLRAALEQ